MTRKKRLFEMKKELKKVKKLLDKSDKCYGDLKWGNAGHYEIIMRDGNNYIIGMNTYDFPDIDFKQIVYVRKFIRIFGGFYDTDIGYYRRNWDYTYHSKVAKKYNEKDMIFVGKPF